MGPSVPGGLKWCYNGFIGIQSWGPILRPTGSDLGETKAPLLSALCYLLHGLWSLLKRSCEVLVLNVSELSGCFCKLGGSLLWVSL